MATPVSRGGVALQHGGGLYTTLHEANQIAGRIGGRSAIVAKRASRYPLAHGVERSERQITLVHMLNTSNIPAALKALEGDHYSAWDDSSEYVFEADGVNKTTQIVPLELARHPENTGSDDIGWYIGTWVLVDQVYYSEDAHTNGPETVPGTLEVTNDGSIESRRATYRLTPTTAKDAADGQRFCRRITVVNVAPNELVDWPVLLVPDGWDTAALTPADMHADGNDAEPYIDHRRAPIWATPGTRDWDTAITHPWTPVTGAPGRYWEIDEALTAGETEITLRTPGVDLSAMPFFVAAGVVPFAGSQEVMLVTAYDEATNTITAERGARNTTATTWSAGERLYRVTAKVDLAYGWTSAPAPTWIDDRLKPIFLDADSSSDNGEWHFGHYYETPAEGDTQSRYPRPGSWRTEDLGPRDRERYEGGDQYTRWIATVDGNPATSMGLQYRAAGPIAGRPIMDRWVFVSPIGMSECSFDYDAGDLGFSPYNNKNVLEVGYIDQDGNHVVDAELADATGSHTITAPTGTRMYAIVLRIKPWDPQVPGAPENTSALEPDDGDLWSVDNVVVTFDPDEQIRVIAPETVDDIYQIGRPDSPATIENAAGDTLQIAGVIVGLDDTLEIDIEAASVRLASDSTGRGHLARGAWPGVPAGESNITYAETGGVGVEIEVEVNDAWV